MTAGSLLVWVIDDDESVRWVLEQAFSQASMQVETFAAADEFLLAVADRAPDVVVTDVKMPGMSGLELLAELNRTRKDIPVIVITAHSDLDTAVAAYQGGAFEYLPKPFDIDDAVALVNRAAQESGKVLETTAAAPHMPAIVGQAPSMQQVFKAIGRLSRSSMTALVTGESGTGKELVARALHENSPRHSGPFIALNTSAIAGELLESELFGHEKGAFTGATERRIGRFEQANGGTLFLDEIGDMSTSLQTRLLRVLAEGEFYRVGGTAAIRVDVRVVAATHQDLAAAVADGRFREDLYHRLNVMRIVVPPLRERTEDILELARAYLERASAELGIQCKSLHPDTTALFERYRWPGNVRELVNLCHRLTATAAGREILPADLPPEMSGAVTSSSGDWAGALAGWADAWLADHVSAPLLDVALPTFERTLILAALKKTGGRRREAAELLGWGRNTLTRKIRELALDIDAQD